MKKLLTSVLFLLCGLLYNCSENESPNGSDPANLVLDLNLADDNSGVLTITVSADNAVEYYFDSGESGIDPETNSSGSFSHTYSITGVYLIEIRAIGSDGRYLKESHQLYIQVGENTGPFDGENGYVTPLIYEGMTLQWQDEFNGNAVDETKWNFEIGRGSNGWGNNELQYYKKENTSVSDGFLVIEAKSESFSGALYTSSRLTTQDKYDFTYGRVDIRAQMPEGQGLWPALWMLGSNISTVGWPACGEVDIMEMIGGGSGRDNTVHGTIHWDHAGSKADYGGSRALLVGNLSDKFHVYSIIWDESSITWYIDDVQYHGASITPEDLSEFQKDFFFIMNVAVGGNWPGSPDATTQFPQRMAVDYIRVFQPE
ncbi:MAG: glycoside hydrolase family 16 protein [Cyclobacteriaceae bacterium]